MVAIFIQSAKKRVFFNKNAIESECESIKNRFDMKEGGTILFSVHRFHDKSNFIALIAPFAVCIRHARRLDFMWFLRNRIVHQKTLLRTRVNESN